MNHTVEKYIIHERERERERERGTDLCHEPLDDTVEY
jgi:hypothetical protein